MLAALELAVRQITARSEPPTREDAADEIDIPSDIRAQLRKEVTEEVTGQVLHEIASPVGLIASSAARETSNYESSRTKQHVDTLKRVFEALERLKIAAAVPKPQEFDLAELLVTLVSEAAAEGGPEASLHGPKPMVITSDPGLLRLAVSNGIQNAVEAVDHGPEGEAHAIIVTWGETDVDYWVAVLDNGTGLLGPTESAFGIGKTTKKGHSGFGLAIARQAIETLNGACSLAPAMSGGTRFEVRWQR